LYPSVSGGITRLTWSPGYNALRASRNLTVLNNGLYIKSLNGVAYNNFVSMRDVPFLRQLSTILDRYIHGQKFRKSVDETLESYYHAKRDPLDLKKTTLSSSERIELHCVWVSEVYTPSNMDSLTKSLKRLGWDKPSQDLVNRGKNLLAQIEQSRSVGGRSGWINDAILLPPGNDKFPLGDKHFVILPEGVNYCRLSVRNITPSITIFTVQFVLMDEYAESLNPPFAKRYKTKVEYFPSRWKTSNASFTSIVDQKNVELDKRRRDIHDSMYAWFRKNIPGHYALIGDLNPTVDFITSKIYTRNEKERPPRPDCIEDVLFGGGSEIWVCNKDKNLELRLPWLGDDLQTMTLFGNYNSLINDTKLYPGSGRERLTAKLDDVFEPTIGVWSTHRLLSDYEEGLAKIRDKTGLQSKLPWKVSKDINYIRRRYLALSRDTKAVCNDVAALVATSRHYAKDTLDFSPFTRRKNKLAISLIENLRTQDEERVLRLQKLEKQVSGIVTTSSELAAAIANIQLQYYVVALTIIVILLTALLLFKK